LAEMSFHTMHFSLGLKLWSIQHE